MQRTYYLREEPRQGQKRGDPIACLISKVDRENDRIEYAVSTGHPKDTYLKVRGRLIASGRLEVHARVLTQEVPKSGHDISRIILTDLIDQMKSVRKHKKEFIKRHYGDDWFFSIPDRVVAAAERWLAFASLPKQQTNGASGKTQEEVKVAPGLSDQQKQNFDYFQSELPHLLKNKFLKNKWVVVSNQDIFNAFDEFKTALEAALHNFSQGNFIIQRVTEQKPVFITRMFGV
jgi:hypothetical protein